MSRFTVILVVMVGTLTINSELMAQYRISNGSGRNISRVLGVGWGAGYHSANPGPINNYYSPWSASNTPGAQRLPAPNFQPNGSEGSSYLVPPRPTLLPERKVESNGGSAPLFPGGLAHCFDKSAGIQSAITRRLFDLY